MTVTSTNQKVQFNGNGSTTVFAYNFKIFAQTDLSVILRSAAGTETVQQLTTNYTVSGVGETSGGNVTMGTAPPSGTTLTILRVQPNLQGLDLVPNDPFPAGSMEDALDKLTFMVQTHDEEIGRSIKASKTNVIADSEFTVSATDRANKLFSFDSSGNLSIAQELGTYKGNWAASTTYAVRDLVKDTSTNNIFIAITAHTSSGSQPLTTNTDSAKWALIVDAASATTSQTAAAASATLASQWAIKTDATVDGTNYSAKYWATRADVGLVAGKATEIGRLGTSDAVADMAILGTTDVVADMNTLATSAIVEDMNLLGTSANVTAMGLLGTSDVVADMALLGTSAVVADMAILGTTDVVADMAILGTSDVVADMNTLATSDIVTDMNLLATSANVAAMAQLGTSDVVADMALLGTSDVVADLAILGTTDVVSDMNTLATSDIVSDMNTLATSANVTAMGLLGTSAVVEDMGLLATSSVISDMSTLTGSGATPTLTSIGVSGNIDVDGIANLDVVDIDGAVDMASTALVTGVLTANGGAVFNENSADVDFRVESNDHDHMLFVDGGNNAVGIKTNTPATNGQFSVRGAIATTSYGNVSGDFSDAATGSLKISHASGVVKLITDQTLSFRTGTSVEGLKIDATGAVTKPLQPAFLAQVASAQTDLANYLNVVIFGTEIFDQNADFNPSNGIFTAPVTGKYMLSTFIGLDQIPATGTGVLQLQIAASNRTVYAAFDPIVFDATSTKYTFTQSLLLDMDASDTAKIQVYMPVSSSTVDINTQSFFSGYLVA